MLWTPWLRNSLFQNHSIWPSYFLVSQLSSSGRLCVLRPTTFKYWGQVIFSKMGLFCPNSSGNCFSHWLKPLLRQRGNSLWAQRALAENPYPQEPVMASEELSCLRSAWSLSERLILNSGDFAKKQPASFLLTESHLLSLGLPLLIFSLLKGKLSVLPQNWGYAVRKLLWAYWGTHAPYIRPSYIYPYRVEEIFSPV